jgi:hypothetical protein
LLIVSAWVVGIPDDRLAGTPVLEEDLSPVPVALGGWASDVVLGASAAGPDSAGFTTATRDITAEGILGT